MEFTGTVKNVEVKKSGSGKTYYRLNIPQDGSDRWHSSFDSNVVDLQGVTINFDATKTQYGWNLKEYEKVQGALPPAAQGNGGHGSRSNHENIWIAAQGLVFRGVEVGFFMNMIDALKWFNRAMPVLQAIWEEDDVAFDELIANLEMQEMGIESSQGEGEA